MLAGWPINHSYSRSITCGYQTTCGLRGMKDLVFYQRTLRFMDYWGTGEARAKNAYGKQLSAFSSPHGVCDSWDRQFAFVPGGRGDDERSGRVDINGL